MVLALLNPLRDWEVVFAYIISIAFVDRISHELAISRDQSRR